MNLIHDNTVIYKLRSWLRFLFIRFLFIGRTKGSWKVTMGRRHYFHLRKKGTVRFGQKNIFCDNIEMNIVGGELSFGNNIYINKGCRFVCFSKITLGDNISFGQDVSLLDHNHGYKLIEGKLELEGYKTGSIILGSNIWIGEKTTILKGVTIGDNVVVGANSLVLKNIPNNCIVGGNPCKVIKYFE